MSKYFTPLHCKYVEPWRYLQEGWSANDGTDRWELTDEFGFYSHILKRYAKVPVGFRFDKASVPTLPVIYSAYGGRYTRAACGHDWLCKEGWVRREVADKVFLELMRYENEEEIEAMVQAGVDAETVAGRTEELENRARSMYAGVRLYSKVVASRNLIPDLWLEDDT